MLCPTTLWPLTSRGPTDHGTYRSSIGKVQLVSVPSNGTRAQKPSPSQRRAKGGNCSYRPVCNVFFVATQARARYPPPEADENPAPLEKDGEGGLFEAFEPFRSAAHQAPRKDRLRGALVRLHVVHGGRMRC